MSTELIATDDFIVQSEGFLVSDMDGEKVMLSIENGKYYNLGQIGGRIWELLSSPNTVTGMVEQLVTEYEIEPNVCEQQVYTFLQQLAAEGIVQVRKQ
ncbi:lasso peptide biosynthesis PqqD family chaperone [Paenibacillus crassostreae]|uniref:Metallophosphoesterase n=1 Tax=Paenibacillus crassostreae TaxID=1763538 RepID=A0A167GCG0_9BACL|nr:lasso peptide biosynthesis PqqD family chaperone [Paenibacillus crassostreae]AOZ92673.1 metallophosphoesterase [Paenibacillus crassostreae]OAB77442.1 metallophosphoesterase [Paenibacillus crassostreae]